MSDGDAMAALIERIESRYAELTDRLADPEVIADRDRYREAGRRYAELSTAHELAVSYRRAESDVIGARELLEGSGSSIGDGDATPEEHRELQAMVEEGIDRMADLGERIRQATVERDPNDSKDVIVEIRAGAGGDEAGIFAGDLFKMLCRFAERRAFVAETLSQSPSDMGGFKEIVFEIRGAGAYSVFKFEAGVHRVQRVPKTESQGRIHTSTVTVAVLPEAEDVEVQIASKDIEVDVFRSTGPGGQSVNTTDSAVRITHKPSGVVVSVQDEKSQLQNRDKAMRILRARLYERAREEQLSELASERRAQVGTGERSEKIRTYNFREARVTDHRVNLTVHNLDAVLDGDLEEFNAALGADEKRRKLESQAAETS